MQSRVMNHRSPSGDGTLRAPRLASVVACTLLLALAGCDRLGNESQTSDEFAWARAALERNPNIEVLAADSQAGVFTVKINRTGATQVIRLAELAAAPASELTMVARTEAILSTPAPAAPPSVAATPPEQQQLAQNPPQPVEPAQIAPAPASLPAEKNYTIERTGGQVKVSGPGISIVSAGAGATAAAQRDPGQRTVDPIICEGRRMLHLDDRNIYVDGDAIIARGGCELYITNSNIIAAGTGVIVQDAIVHVANSTIEGTMASFDAGDQAKMYLRGSTFQGLPRRAERAVVQDQGGNRWR